MKIQVYKGILLAGTALLAVGCGKYVTGSAQNGATQDSATQSQIKVGMKINDGSTEIFSDASTTSLLALKAEKTYNVVLSPSQAVSGLNYKLVLIRTSVIGGENLTIPMTSGTNSFSVPVQGDYAMRLVVTAPNMQQLTKYYTAAVSCAHPTFSLSSLNPDAIAMTPTGAAGTNNLFNVTAAGVTAQASGQAPYLCAFDPTGTGIVNTGFTDCTTGATRFYSNFVGTRKVSVLVKDACNTIHTVSKVLNVPYTIPSSGNQNVFVSGQVSSATGAAMGDSRVDGVTYLATNQNPDNNIVQPAYSNGNFTINVAQNYKLASSVPFGMNIQIQGITGSLDLPNSSGSLSMAGASIKSLSYSTDQSGDSRAATTYSNGTCVLSDTGVKVLFAIGTPCTEGNGSGRRATVEVWGSYSCTNLKSATGTINLAGKFDGATVITDSCIAGGQEGGILPIKL